MDRKITSRLNMFNAAKKVCDDKPETVNSVTAFALLVAKLGVFIAEIRNLIKQLSQNNEGISAAKTQVSKELALMLSVVCGAGVSYGKHIKDLVLEKRFDYPESDFTRMRDVELLETADNLIVLQATYDKELLPYGINANLVLHLKDLRDQFEQKSAEPIVNVYTGEADRNELLKKTFEVSDFVLNDLMSAAKIFKLNDPNFFAALDNASRISKVGIRHDEPVVNTEAKAVKQQLAALKKQVKEAKQSKLEQKRLEEKAELEQLIASLSEASNKKVAMPGFSELNVNVPVENGR